MTFPTFSADTLRAAEVPTLYFIGVTTGSSSIQHVFPLWADALGLDGAVLQGIDLPLHAPRDDYRRVVEFIAADPLSLGALVTTHKIDLYDACSDLFDEIDPFARLMGETSCISKRDGRLVCHAKDPISSGLALDAFVPEGWWSQSQAHALSMGAGGSTIAISWYLSRRESGADRPARIVVTNRSEARLDHLREIHAQLDTDTAFEYVLTPTREDNDRVLATLPPRSLVVNATGLGKDAPGSPLTDAGVFPEHGIAWDLNYRGDLVFLDQARAQQDARALRVEDGWIYFVHGWTQVIAEVFHVGIPTSGPSFERLGELARSARP
ncbi:shikimate dehydrogenase family protein [Microbacterium sp. XT11]|uniref:shikimate dehydrogenase family protein n=1 Tax=Microbacterium sp. XT11 TaxID=367477 RepID=UPI00074310C8|nr:shikimate dehydrogenase [Microbacterium sp. XT11]ALX65765.1 shikimate 5-dehydrogenase [Microbacterium sp. XT11]